MKLQFSICLVLLAIFACSQASMVSYEGCKVYRITPTNAHHTRVLQALERTKIFDFWKVGKFLYKSWDVMVKPNMQSNFESVLLLNNMKYFILIENVERILTPEISSDLSRSGRISFQEYNRYDTITAYLKQLETKYPNLVKVFSIGKTTEGRDLLGVRISTDANPGNKPVILVDGGIHAREWLAPATTTYIIQQLVENSANANMLKNVDWHIVPVLNPDGYEYTFTSDRMWRKTRSKGKYCNGVDANRNWGFHWNEVGASDYECDDTYAGPRAFSEPETEQLKQYVLKTKNIKLYLTFHSYGEMLLYPWGFTSDYPDNADELQSLGEKVNNAIEAVRGTEYVVGSSTNVLYPAAGGSDDWMMGVAGVPLTYTIELPGLGYGFQPPAREIDGVVKETFQGIKVYHKYIEQQYRN